MRIRCWGARGSIPVSGPEYLKYGGDTTCVEVRTRDGQITLLDAGTGIRRLGLALLAEGLRRANLLFTHAHWDHLLGLPFFQPLYRRGFVLDVFGSPCAQQSVRTMVSDAMAPPYFPVRIEEVEAAISFHEDCEEDFVLGELAVSPVKLSHPNCGLGYRLAEGGRSFVFLTDNELDYQHPDGGTFDDYARFCEGAELLIHDAEFTLAEYAHTRGWGHSVYVRALDLALAAGVRRLGLFHHNHERTDDEIDALVADCNERAAREGTELECFAAAQGLEMVL
jgi:phosphoribosyl 1,2-cyclic phosphodiesterase